VDKRLTLPTMNEEKFNKAVFLAKLKGDKALGDLMLELVQQRHEEYAFRIVRMFSPGAITPPTCDNVSEDRHCNMSPYGYCFTNRLGKNIEQFHPDSMYCIWCESIYTPPNKVEPRIDLALINFRYGDLHRE